MCFEAVRAPGTVIVDVGYDRESEHFDGGCSQVIRLGEV